MFIYNTYIKLYKTVCNKGAWLAGGGPPACATTSPAAIISKRKRKH